MTVLFENVQYLSGATGATTKRTPAQRAADIINVKDFGAKGDGSTDDTVPIQAAIAAMYALTTKSGVVFFPPGNYIITSTIDIGNSNLGSIFTAGIICGSGKFSTQITGTLNNGFLFSQTDGVNGPEEISNIGFANASTVIGTGCLLINNTNMRIRNCSFGGMVGVLMPSNIYNVQIESCPCSSNTDVTTGHTGTFGIAGGNCSISGCRSTSSFQAAIQLGGSQQGSVLGCSNENTTVGLLVGMNTGWASSCTVSGNVLTVGGNLGSAITTQFSVGSELFMKGLTTTADWGISPLDATICTITETHTENPSRTGQGFAGTYTISRSAVIASPVPCISRTQSAVSSSNYSGYGCEAAYYPVFVMGASDCAFIGCGGSGTPTECVDAFGVTGFTAHSSFYLYSVGGCSFIGCGASNNPYKAGWYFDPNKNQVVSLISCTSQKLADNITGTSSSISNGSGGAGTILNVLSNTGSTIGIGMSVTVGGVAKGTVIGNHATDGTLTGTGGTGTYRLDTSNLVTGSAITIHTGDDYSLPSTNAGKTGVELFNTVPQFLPAGYTSGLNSLNRTFTSLPGQAGANNNIQVVYGMEYDIVDSTTATWGANVTIGGGTNKVSVRYNGTNWTVMGV